LGIRSSDEIAEFLGVAVVLPDVSPAKLAVLQDYSADLIRDVSREAISKINQAIARGIVGELTPKQVADEIVPAIRILKDPAKRKPGIFTSIFNRAEKIMRTEMHRVNQIASQARLEQLVEQRPQIMKQWVATIDARTRRTHRMADGQIKKIDQPFIVGGHELMFPGDPAGPPEEVINCRCQSIMITKEVA